MADLKFFKENFDKFLEDAKIQVESLSKDIQQLPQTLENGLGEAQEKAAEAQAHLLSFAEEVKSGAILERDFKGAIKESLQTAEAGLNGVYDNLKAAIKNAKEQA